MKVIGTAIPIRFLAWGIQHTPAWLISTPRPGMWLPIFLLMSDLVLPGCGALMSKATSGLSANLSAAILDQDDPETVRDGVPAFLLILDSLVAGSPEDVRTLSAAAELYAAYGVVFVDDAERAKRLTQRSWHYGQRALCSANPHACGLWELPFREIEPVLNQLDPDDCAPLYSYGLSWLAYIQAHSDEAEALASLPQATAVMQQIRSLDPGYRPGQVEVYLAVLKTIRPPALGGDFEAGRAHYERAMALTGGRDLSVQVKFARYYARTLYDRDLHDRLLLAVLAADPHEPGMTLTNTLAQREARVLINSADAYF